MTIRKIIWLDFRGIRTVELKPSLTCWLVSVEHGDSLGNKGKMGRGRRAMDDGRQRHLAPGKCLRAMRRAGLHGFSTVGQSAFSAEDDRPEVSGQSRPSAIPEIADDDGTRVRVGLRRILGQKRGQWRA